MQADSPILTLAEVAAYLRIHRVTAYRLAQRGVIPHFRVGSDYRFSRAAVDKWIETNTVDPDDAA